jgi:hypothetical protein
MITGDVLSRHRLPNPYRYLLTGLWLTPLALLICAVCIGRGFSPAIFDPRFLLPLGLMSVPALYVWQEGVDVLAGGVKVRVYWPRYHAFTRLEGWHITWRHEGRILTIWARGDLTVLQCHTAHLSGLPVLLKALAANVRPDSSAP